MNRFSLIAGVVVVVLGIGVFSSTFIVRETDQYLVSQFGDVRRVVRDPGLKLKWPWQNAIRYDKRTLNLDPPVLEVILNDQKRIILDAFARYRISNPKTFFETVRFEATFNDRFGRVLNSAIRASVARRGLVDLLSDARSDIMRNIFEQVNLRSRDFGIELIDIRIGRSELPEQVSRNVYDRMRSEREREANLLRAEGEENSRRIRATADRQKAVILAEAERESEILRGAGDAQRNLILGEAYGRDPGFFDFYRTLQAYREALNPEDTTLLLSPDSEFFRFFRDISGGKSDMSGPRPDPDPAR